MSRLKILLFVVGVTIGPGGCAVYPYPAALGYAYPGHYTGGYYPPVAISPEFVVGGGGWGMGDGPVEAGAADQLLH